MDLMEFFHEGDKAVHVRAVLVNIYDSDIFIRDTDLDVIGRKELVIPHVVLLHPHESGIMIRFGIAVAVRAADPDLFHVISELQRILLQLFIIPLFPGFMMAAPMHKGLLVNAAEEGITGKDQLKTFGSVFGIRLYLKTGVLHILVDPVQQQGDLLEETVPGFLCGLFPDKGIFVRVGLKL